MSSSPFPSSSSPRDLRPPFPKRAARAARLLLLYWVARRQGAPIAARDLLGGPCPCMCILSLSLSLSLYPGLGHN